MTDKITFIPEEDREARESKPRSWLGKMLTQIFLFVLIVGLLAGCIGLAGWRYYEHELKTAMDPEAGLEEFTIYEDQSIKGIANRLQEQGFIKNPLIFRLALKLQHKDTAVGYGDFTLSKSQTMQEIIDSLRYGRQTEIQIRIKEGWRIEDIASYLSIRNIVDEQTFLDLAYAGNFEYPFLQSSDPYGKPAGSSLEGYLFPDTYRITADATEQDIIIMLLNNFQDKYDEVVKYELGTGSLFETLILASIVEREASDPQAMQMIAQVFYNRLAAGKSLGSDVTVLYALGDWSAPLNADTLQIDSPYNTRTKPGLPPGPISNPGLDAIKAAIDPADNDYLFFLADKNGTIRYARTNAEHEYNKATYGLSGE